MKWYKRYRHLRVLRVKVVDRSTHLCLLHNDVVDR